VEGGRGAAVFQPLRDLELAGGAGLLALPRHRHLEAGGVDGDAALAADVGGEVERKSVGVVQLEGDVAAEDAARACGRQRGDRRLQDLHAVGDRLEEALLLLAQHVGGALLLAAQLRVGIAHLRPPARRPACGRTASSRRACSRGGSPGG
jgi:hypothetical protein